MTRVSACLALLVACGSDPQLEPGEERPGGDTTLLLLVSGSQAYTFPSSNLSSERRGPFFTGNAFFGQAWVTAPSTTTARDGLGPTFNGAACSTCHFRDGRGTPPEDNATLTSVLIRLSIPGVDEHGGPLPDPAYGGQFQPFGVREVPGEGRVFVRWTEEAGAYEDGTPYSLRRPEYVFEDLSFGPLSSEIQFSPRVAPHMIGLGLLEAIPAARLEELADPDDADGDAISGEIQRVWDPEAGAMAIGRFGWKSEQPTVRHQTAGAFFGDLGITSSLHPVENCPPGQDDCAAAPNGGAPEIDDELLEKVSFYSRTLAPPFRPRALESEVLRGRSVFRRLSCDGCHVANHQTGTLEGFPELSDQSIWPYTDLLLHDMGPDLADARPVFEADGQEWRTPPLWGLGYLESVNGHQNLLHDGRARGFAEAILWHGGEAEEAREAFRALSEADRARLIAFLESL
ncbi:MAG: di-heme oxidoredictase family protein [Myxococcota bacterium]